MKTAWDFTLFYKSPKDPQIDKDVEKIKKTILAFEKKYKNKTDYLKSDTALLKALQESERIAEEVTGKPLHYYSLRLAANSNDAEAEAKLTKLSNELTQYENRILFFDLKLGAIPKAKQQAFLKSKKLEKYKYMLSKLFENSKFNLSEAEEKILNLKGLPSYGLWVQGVEKLLNKQTVNFKGREISMGEAQNKVDELPTKERRELQDLIMTKVRDNVSDFAESEMNAVVINKKIGDDLRKRKTPYEATVASYQNDPKVVENLVDVVTKHFPISHRFFELKKKLLNVPHLEYADRAAKVGKIERKFPFDESLEIFRNSLQALGPRYVDILDTFVKNGQIDVFPRQYKDTGAFCSAGTKMPTMVLLNHTDTIRSASTLAHEMGHAIHFELAKANPVIYQGCSTSVAETASTFFENFVFDELLKTLTPKEKIFALHDQINDDISTVFRQIAFFNFERDLHASVKAKGFLSKEEIANLLNKHMEAYLGPAFKMKELDGYFFVKVSHFRRFFYVYAYAYGQLISKALYQMFKNDPKNFKSIEKFMLAGESATPENIFKASGVNVKDPKFFAKGLKEIESKIIELERLVKENPDLVSSGKKA